MLQVKKFSGSVKEILPLADIYMRSYNELSKQYKSSAEMQLYTKGSFIKKLKTWAGIEKQIPVITLETWKADTEEDFKKIYNETEKAIFNFCELSE